MINFDVVIGIEVHAVINTKSKMFSNAKNDYNSKPNTLVSFMDLALPGILPLVNRSVIDKAIILADALKMKINYKNIKFDRKNYFYPDLPKGFQITQQYLPIGQNGYIEIFDDNNNIKKIKIERIHIEEDTAKQFSENNIIQLDYNRAGCPLIEIVTEPCISSAQEAMNYLHELKRLLIFKNISFARLEDGLMRADVNISINPKNSKNFGTRVELKNLNSISNVGKAIEYEIKRHISLLLSNQEIIQETRKYNDALNITESLRSKSDAIDYRYMTEPNIVSFSYSDDYVNKLISNSNPSPSDIKKHLLSTELNDAQISFLLDNYDYYCLFDQMVRKINNYKIVFNWLNVELAGILNKKNLTINSLSRFLIDEFIELLTLLNAQEINSKQAKILFEKLFDDDQKTIVELIRLLGFEQIKDENVIGSIIDKIIEQNKNLVSQYKERPERVEKFIVGMVMKETNSQANPVITNKLMLQKLSSFK